jgi:hypothetical protein
MSSSSDSIVVEFAVSDVRFFYSGEVVFPDKHVSMCSLTVRFNGFFPNKNRIFFYPFCRRHDYLGYGDVWWREYHSARVLKVFEESKDDAIGKERSRHMHKDWIDDINSNLGKSHDVRLSNEQVFLPQHPYSWLQWAFSDVQRTASRVLLGNGKNAPLPIHLSNIEILRVRGTIPDEDFDEICETTM